jgi:hypothetical protein
MVGGRQVLGLGLLVMALLVVGLCGAPLRAEEPGVAPVEQSMKEQIAEARWAKVKRLLAEDKIAEARPLIVDIARKFPGTPPGLSAMQWLRRHPAKEQSGRSDYIWGGLTNGGLLGQYLAIGIGEFDQSSTTLGILGGMAVGGGLSAIVAPHLNVTKSQAIWFHSNSQWGFYNGLILADMLAPLSRKTVFGGLGGSVAGMLASAVVWDKLDTHSGAAAFASMSGFFGMEMAFFGEVMMFGGRVYSEHEIPALLGLLVASNGALIGGYYLGQKLQWRARDVGWISIGGTTGTFLGMIIVFANAMDSALLQDEFYTDREMAGAIIGSTLGGLALATLIVRPWRRAGPDEVEKELWSSRGSILHLDETGIHPGVPALQVMPMEYKGRRGISFQIPVLTVGL